MKLWGIAAGSAAIALGVKFCVPGLHVVIRGVAALGLYGLLYLGGATAAGIPEAVEAIRPIRRYLSAIK